MTAADKFFYHQKSYYSMHFATVFYYKVHFDRLLCANELQHDLHTSGAGCILSYRTHHCRCDVTNLSMSRTACKQKILLEQSSYFKQGIPISRKKSLRPLETSSHQLHCELMSRQLHLIKFLVVVFMQQSANILCSQFQFLIRYLRTVM